MNIFIFYKTKDKKIRKREGTSEVNEIIVKFHNQCNPLYSCVLFPSRAQHVRYFIANKCGTDLSIPEG